MRNYKEEVKEYVEQMKRHIEDNYDFYDYVDEEVQDQEKLYERLYDEMWVDDNITGNGTTGGFTKGDQEYAKEMVSDALSVLKEAVRDFGCTEKAFEALLNQDFIYLDATIRCYLLGQVLTEVLKEKGLYE